MRNNPLVKSPLLWLGTLLNFVGWVALSVLLHFTDPVGFSVGTAVATVAIGFGLSFVAIYFLHKRLVS